MNVKKCTGGHFFDADKYQLCPHCGASVEEIREVEKPAEQKSEGSIFAAWKKRRNHHSAEATPLPQKTMGKTFGVFEEQPKQPEPSKVVRGSSSRDPARETGADKPAARQTELYTPSPELIDCPKCGHKTSATSKFCRYCGSGLTAESPKAPQPPVEEIDVNAIFDHSGAVRSQRPQEQPPAEPKQEAPNTNRDAAESKLSGQSPFEAAVRSAVSAADGKTIGFFSMGTSEPQNDSEPVVGWLVCVRGKHFGESFQLAAGRNAVGRSLSNKIVIHKDNAVSREKHIWITYDPKNRDFFVQPGEGSGLTYLNGELVMEFKKLKAMDKIEFGEGMYLLVPLCGGDFSWEAYM